MSSPRRIASPPTPADTPPPAASSPSLAVPQIPPRPSSSSSPASHTPLYGSPRRSPAFPPQATTSASSPGGASGLARSRADAPSPLPPNAFDAGGATATGVVPALSDAQKAEVIRKHLLSAEEQQRLAEDQALQSGISLPPGVGSRAASPATGRSAFPQEAGDEEFPTPYHLQGGDVVAGVYKYVQQQAMGASPSGGAVGMGFPGGGGLGSGADTPQGGAGLRRSKSMDSVAEGATSRRASHAAGPGGAGAERAAFRANLAGGGGAGGAAAGLSEAAVTDDPAAFSTAEMLQPGGFRRDFVYRRLAEQQQRGDGVSPSPGSDASSDVGASGVSASPLPPVRGRYPTRSFIDFLSLYGHFGGEDLEEIEEEDEDEDLLSEEETAVGGIPPYSGSGSGTATERTPLVRARSHARGASRKRASMAEGKQQGDATVAQAVMMLLKSFVGTGVLFLGKAFYNGGILFSALALCFIAMISLYSFLLLVETRLVINGSFGDIGGVLYGKYMRWAILSSIVLSQIGFVSAYLVFVSENLRAFFTAVTNCRANIPIPYLIMAQLIIFLPLAMIRNIQKLSGTALVADAFIVIGLVYIFGNEIAVLAHHGVADVALFNKNDFPLLIGTAVFAFEGIGLIIPVQEAMAEPHKLPKVLTGVMIGVMSLFAGAGTLAYLTYGSKIQTVVFVNLPQTDRLVNSSQFLYSLAILLSTPLQLFPAVRIMENGLFGNGPTARSGKNNPRVKWEKNGFRAASVVGCALIAWLGANDLDRFVSLIGSIACPPLLHYRACARTRKQKIIDVVLVSFGVACALFTGTQTILSLFSPSNPSGPPPPPRCTPRA
ncbi:hypothetical protein JCM6882_009721 [Rhodosporidiobolus microsporus]